MENLTLTLAVSSQKADELEKKKDIKEIKMKLIQREEEISW
jgi:hypothetical protein